MHGKMFMICKLEKQYPKIICTVSNQTFINVESHFHKLRNIYSKLKEYISGSGFEWA